MQLFPKSDFPVGSYSGRDPVGGGWRHGGGHVVDAWRPGAGQRRPAHTNSSVSPLPAFWSWSSVWPVVRRTGTSRGSGQQLSLETASSAGQHIWLAVSWSFTEPSKVKSPLPPG